MRKPSRSVAATLVLVAGALVPLPSIAFAAPAPIPPLSCSVDRTPGASSAVITWDRADNDNATRFVVERSANGGSWHWAAKADAPRISVTNTGLSANSTYTYRVFTKAGSVKSARINCAAAADPEPPAPPPAPPPGAPIPPLSCSVDRTPGASSAVITWDRADNDNATRFVVERSANGGSWHWAAKADAPRISVTNTGLSANSTYTYRVFTKAGSVKSARINCAAAADPEPPAPPPAPPPGAPIPPLSCSVDRTPGASSAVITWDRADNDNATRFVVERSANGGSWYWAGRTNPPVTEFTNVGLTSSRTYAYRVFTKTADGRKSVTKTCATLTDDRPIEIVLDVANLMPAVVEDHATGLNLNWLLDSDIHRPREVTNRAAIDGLGADVLRFPFGHLADNYLWDTTPFGGELTPHVASHQESPGLSVGRDWSWAVNPDGSFIDAMDFDEFMSITTDTASTSVVVINAAAHKYAGGPTYEALRETAVEWVRYAVTSGYDVDYWQIGNEIDHRDVGVLTAAEYVALYRDFTTAMRAIDPTIKVGPGLIGLEPFTSDVVEALADDMDFVSAHQYAGFRNCAAWRDSTTSPVPLIESVQQVVSASVNPDLPILVTETNSSGSKWDNGSAITTCKALVWFDMLISQQQLTNVVSSLMWTTHSPWSGEHFVGNDHNALFNDSANAPTPNGTILQLFGDTVHSRFVDDSEQERFGERVGNRAARDRGTDHLPDEPGGPVTVDRHQPVEPRTGRSGYTIGLRRHRTRGSGSDLRHRRPGSSERHRSVDDAPSDLARGPPAHRVRLTDTPEVDTVTHRFSS